MKTNYVVDIDGTVAKVGDRLKHINCDSPDWDAFFEACDEDDPIKEV